MLGDVADQSIRLNVCLMPPPNVAARLVELTEEMPRSSSQLFRIDGIRRLPHLTIFMATFSTSSVHEVIERIKRLLVDDPIVCTAYGITVTGDGYIEVGYAKTSQIHSLQVAVASEMMGMRISGRIPAEDRMNSLERLNAETYGYKLYGEMFRPHVSLAAYDSCSAVAVPVVTPLTVFDFITDSLVVAESDEFGSVVRRLSS